MVDVLTNTQPGSGPAGPSKAKYTLTVGTAERVTPSGELLTANPLYPGSALGSSELTSASAERARQILRNLCTRVTVTAWHRNLSLTR